MLTGRALRQLTVAGRGVCLGVQRTAPGNNTSCNLLAASAPTSDVRQQARRHKSTSSADVVKQAKAAAQTTTPATTSTQVDELQEVRPARPIFYHDQMEWLDERLVRISKPTKNVMQSGTASTHCWKIEFDSQPRDEYWLIGWTGTKDPMSNMSLTFPSKEAAIRYCNESKLQWFLEEQPERKVRRKSYADNFSWNKRTRLGSK